MRQMQGGGEHADHAHGWMDPHTWLDPVNVKKISENICTELIRLDPEHEDEYKENLRGFLADLDELGRGISQILLPFKGREFFVFHPVFGYLGDRYGLVQRAVEVEGKEPSARQLAGLIADIREKGARVIFVQPQFSSKSAEAIAKAVGGKTVAIDPLARDYLTNMEHIAVKLAEGLRSR